MANKYVVTTDSLFITDDISVSRGMFDADEYNVDVEKLDKLCEKHPRDIRRATQEEAYKGSRSARVEKGNKPIAPNVETEGTPGAVGTAKAPENAPEAPKTPAAPKAPQAPQADGEGTSAKTKATAKK